MKKARLAERPKQPTLTDVLGETDMLRWYYWTNFELDPQVIKQVSKSMRLSKF